MIGWLAVTRFLHFADVGLLFGLAAFPAYASVRGEGARPSLGLLRTLAVLAPVTSLLVLGATAAGMIDDPGAAFSPSAITSAIQGTLVGQIWGLRTLLALAVTGLAFRPQPWDGLLRLACALLLITVALAGHSRMPQGPLGLAHVFSDALHLIAAGAWIGGLLALLLAARLRRLNRPGVAAGVLEQFSGMGYFAVATLVLTGLFNSWILVGAPAGLLTPYGAVLGVKLVLFAGMGGLALANRLRVAPALARRDADAALWLGRLRTQVGLEFALGLGVLAAVAVLGALEPPVSR